MNSSACSGSLYVMDIFPDEFCRQLAGSIIAPRDSFRLSASSRSRARKGMTRAETSFPSNLPLTLIFPRKSRLKTGVTTSGILTLLNDGTVTFSDSPATRHPEISTRPLFSRSERFHTSSTSAAPSFATSTLSLPPDRVKSFDSSTRKMMLRSYSTRRGAPVFFPLRNGTDGFIPESPLT